VQPIEAQECLEQRLLDDVLGLVRCPHDPPGDAQRLAAVAVDELAERGLVAGEHPADDDLVSVHSGLRS
jgi:hypothetical protein